MLFPQRAAVEQAVIELQGIGVPRKNLHTIAKQGIDISGLPKATLRQKTDIGAKVEAYFWNLNLIVFFSAFLVMIAALIASNMTAALLSACIMFATFIAGYYFASHVPHAHLDECSSAIKHGEILLLVDVPVWKLKKAELLIHKLHPDMLLGGVTWTLPGL